MDYLDYAGDWQLYTVFIYDAVKVTIDKNRILYFIMKNR